MSKTSNNPVGTSKQPSNSNGVKPPAQKPVQSNQGITKSPAQQPVKPVSTTPKSIPQNSKAQKPEQKNQVLNKNQPTSQPNKTTEQNKATEPNKTTEPDKTVEPNKIVKQVETQEPVQDENIQELEQKNLLDITKIHSIKLPSSPEYQNLLNTFLKNLLRILLPTFKLKLSNITSIIVDDSKVCIFLHPRYLGNIVVYYEEDSLFRLGMDNLQKWETANIFTSLSPEQLEKIRFRCHIGDKKIELQSSILQTGPFFVEKTTDQCKWESGAMITLCNQILRKYQIDPLVCKNITIDIWENSMNIHIPLVNSDYENYDIHVNWPEESNLTNGNVNNLTVDNLIPMNWNPNDSKETCVLKINENSITMVSNKLQEEPFGIYMNDAAEMLPSQRKALIKFITSLVQKLPIPLDEIRKVKLEALNRIEIFSKNNGSLLVSFKTSELFRFLSQDIQIIEMDNLLTQTNWLQIKNTYIGELRLQEQKMQFISYLLPAGNFPIVILETEISDLLENHRNNSQPIPIIRFLTLLVNSFLINHKSISAVKVTKDEIVVCFKNEKEKEILLSIFYNYKQLSQITKLNLHNIQLDSNIQKEEVYEYKDNLCLTIEKEGIYIMPYNIKSIFPIILSYNFWPQHIRQNRQMFITHKNLIERFTLSLVQKLNISINQMHKVEFFTWGIFLEYANHKRSIRIEYNSDQMQLLTENNIETLVVDQGVKDHLLVLDAIEQGPIGFLIMKDDKIRIVTSLLQIKPFPIIDERSHNNDIEMRQETLMLFVNKLVKELNLDLTQIKYIGFYGDFIVISDPNNLRSVYFNKTFTLSKLTKENIEKKWNVPPKAPLFNYHIHLNLQVIDDTITLQYS